MPVQVTREAWRAIFPRAPQAVIDAFASKQSVLDAAGITETRTRLAYFVANIEHECGGFTIPNLTENINYTAARMAQVWPNRFKNAAAVQAKYGTASGWQKKAFDDIYGSRMGNRLGTSDGSTFIGRGGPQWTGRDGYANCEKRSGVPAVSIPQAVSQLDLQPEICAAFWSWKALNAKADVGNFKGLVKIWNGGTNGLADREHLMAGNDPIIARMAVAATAAAKVKPLPGGPATPVPPKSVVKDATKKERNARTTAGAAGSAAGLNEGAKTSTEVAGKPLMSSGMAYGLIGVAVVAVVILTVIIARKKAAVIRNWF
ncbi:glycosyl hydrolase [Tardiphaga sp. 709]|uniref:glycoside hydrolase family 19 protein n=1 Tax=Tardiphaga sp. 709 TaxID=3076039 RepID=UPI0028E3C41D|nr:glycosyl hydrolase [Tardiphaga sp. 709]WNV10082.1 glycosyl hydrolase [Tardiphaga sp. 709]